MPRIFMVEFGLDKATERMDYLHDLESQVCFNY